MANLKFYKGTESQVNLQNPAVGSIWFNTTDRTINVRVLNGEGVLGWEKYTGLVDATFDKGILTITKAKGEILQLNLSDVASAKTLAEIIDLVNGNEEKGIEGLVLKVSNLQTATGANASAIKTLNNDVIPTLATKVALESEATERGKVAASVENLSKIVNGSGEGETKVDGLVDKVADLQTVVGALTGEGSEGSSITERINQAIDNLDLPNTYEAKGTSTTVANAVKSEILGYGTEEVPSTDAQTIKGVNDRIDDVAAAAKSYSIAAVTGDELAGLGANVKEAYKLIDEDSAKAGEYIKIYKDSALQSVVLDGQELVFTYLLANGEEDVVRVDVSSFLAESEFENGLQVIDHVVSVKLSNENETKKYLSVDVDGLKLSGVDKAITEAVDNIVIPEIPNVTASGDSLVSATADGHAVTVGATETLTIAVGKAISAVQTIETGKTNGTIAVDGNEVAVYGLKSAAFKDASAFDEAGAAAAAKAAVIGDAENDTKDSKTIEGVRKYVTDQIENSLSWAYFE
jgi:hypothetical protein